MNVLNFTKKSFTKGGFRLVGNYINGLIFLAKKTVNKIAKASSEVNHQQKLNRINLKRNFWKKDIYKR